MVLTISVLTRNNAHLALIWKLATTRHSKIVKVSKQNFLHHNVNDTCRTILKLVEGNRTKQEKCSLYIIAQLMYGTTIVYSKQIEFLCCDVEEVVSLIKRHYFDLGTPRKTPKRRNNNDCDNDEEYRASKKRSKKNTCDENIDLDNFPMLDSQALPENITIKENILLRTPVDQIMDGDDLVPLSENDYNSLFAPIEGSFFDYQTLTGTQNTNGDVRNASSFMDQPVQSIEDFELLPSAPPQEDSPTNRTVNFMPMEDEYIRQSQITPRKSYSNEVLEPSAELRSILTKGICGNDQSRSIEIDEELEEIRAASMNDVDRLNPFVVPQSFELGDLEEALLQTPMRTPQRRRRAERACLQITHAEMRKVQEDYSFLVHENTKSLCVKKRAKGEMTVKELLHPSPYFHLNKRFNPKLMKLYEQKEKFKFNYELGTTVLEEEEEEEDDESVTKSSKQGDMSELDLENLRFLTTPIKDDKETPPSTPKTPINPIDFQNDFEIPRPSPINASIVAPVDVSLNGDLNTLNNVSQNSPKKRSLYEFDTPRKEYYEASCDVASDTIRESIMRKAEMSAPFPAKFDDLFDKSTNVRVAAKSFYVLLEMVKEQIVQVNQDEPYSTIEYHIGQQIDQVEDIDDVAQMENDEMADDAFMAVNSS